MIARGMHSRRRPAPWATDSFMRRRPAPWATCIFCRRPALWATGSFCRRPAPWATGSFCRRPAPWATDSISNRRTSLLARNQIQRFRYKGRARGALLQGMHRRRRPAPWATGSFCRRPALWATDSISNRCISLLAKRQIQRFRYKGRARGALLRGSNKGYGGS